MQDISIQEALDMQKKKVIFIDVRSPAEFETATIPGAVNVPLFDNREREIIGTIYKNEGSSKAKWLAMEMVSPKIPSLMKEIRTHQEAGLTPVIFCWRGGMRSKAVATFANYAGLQVYRLSGGYRSFRQHVVQSLSDDMLPQQFIVLHGFTGIGKTRILQSLSEMDQPVLDLEEMAGHRGSVFGHIGIGRQQSQKAFDGSLFQQLRQLQGKPYTFMEAESKRIGRVVLPDFLLQKKEEGIHVLLTAPVDVRVERTFQEYVAPYQSEPWFQDRVREAIQTIEKRLPKDIAPLMHQLLEQKQYRDLISLLFEHYYDPRYAHKLKQYQKSFIELDATDMVKVAANLIQLAEKHTRSSIK